MEMDESKEGSAVLVVDAFPTEKSMLIPPKHSYFDMISHTSTRNIAK